MNRYVVELLFPDGTRKELRVEGNQHIFNAALEQGIELPFSCLQGWCLSCAAKIVEGEVDQSDSLSYYPADREAGFALLCSGKARSDLVLKTFAADEMREMRKLKGIPFPREKWGDKI